MTTSKATTHWNGGLSNGSGTTKLGSGLAEFAVDWRQRSTGEGSNTTPEELLAAAHSACFAMALSNELESNGTPPTELQTGARVSFTPGTGITSSVLTVNAQVPGMSLEDFTRIAEQAKQNCPMSLALTGIEISLESADLDA